MGGIVGGIVGFGVGLLITEVIIGNPPITQAFDWAFWADAVLVVVGVLVGVALARRYRTGRSIAT